MEDSVLCVDLSRSQRFLAAFRKRDFSPNGHSDQSSELPKGHDRAHLQGKHREPLCRPTPSLLGSDAEKTGFHSFISPEYTGSTIQSVNSHDTSRDRGHHSLKMSGSSHRLWLWCQLLSSPGITGSLLCSQSVTSGGKPSLSPSPAQGRALPSLSSSLFSLTLHEDWSLPKQVPMLQEHQLSFSPRVRFSHHR